MEESQEQDNSVSTTQSSNLPVKVEPKAPYGLSEEQKAELESKAIALAAETLEDSANRKVLRKFDQLGSQDQEALSHKMGFLQERVGKLMNDVEGKDNPVPKNLMELRTHLDDLNPEKSLKRKVLGLFPRKIRTVLLEISARYETVSSQIDHILKNLSSGKDQLMEDNAELETLLEQVEIAKRHVEGKAYIGELIIQKIEAELAKGEAKIGEVSVMMDEKRKKNLQKLLHRTYMRVQDMRVMEQVDWQFDAAITTTMDNNDQLIDTISRTLNIARPLLSITLSIAVALQRQKTVAEATQAAQSAMGDMLAANAKAVRDQSVQIAEMANNPVLAIEKVQAAHSELMAAMDEAEAIRAKGIEQAKGTINQMQTMTKDLSTRVESYRQNNPLPAIEEDDKED